MKKQSIILSVFLCFSLQLFAQIGLDLEFGSNFSTSKFNYEYFEDFEDEVEIGNRVGFYIGITPRVDIFDRLAVSASIQYSEEGLEYTDIDNIYKYQYIRLIPELELKIIEGLKILGGVNLGYLLDEEIKVEEEWFDPVIKITDDIDFGVTFGAKYRINRFLFSARYNLGIRDIGELSFTDIDGNDLGNLEQQNRTLQLGVGIRFIK